MGSLNELSSQEIGRRLRLAREVADVRQEEAAQVIGMSRPTLVSIEQGARPVRSNELQILAHRYGVSVNALLRREAVHTDLLPRFRKLRETENHHVAEAISLFNDLIRADVELENVLGIERRRNYPPEKGISQGDVSQLASQHACELREWLGLGQGPIADIFAVIEFDLGIRLFQRRLSSSSKVAGLFTYDDTVGACIFLNANHPLARRTLSASHEVGHFYGTRRNPEVLEEDEKFLSRDERYANTFGRVFLAPEAAFTKSFRQLREITGKTSVSLVVRLAHQYGISRQACVLQLEELSLAKRGTWEWFLNRGGISDDHARQVLGEQALRADPAKRDADRLVAHKTALMAHLAWKRDIMTEGQLSELLKIGRLELREVIDQIEVEDRESDILFGRQG
jgi:Zn-dependent peptidase ImmA (M78 family)